tara:strand:+ start:38 stop:238 length:201 start_codon:yes stop_codon:yes gene_type:complete
MSKEIIEQLQEEIKEAYVHFDDEHHFNQVFEMAGWDEDYMRIYDCGYIKGLQLTLSKLQEEYGETE